MNGRYSWTLEAGAYCGAVAAVVAIGAVNLYYPLGPDQAIIFYGSKLLDQGAIYYAEYWDNKQPGLYVFYLLAGRAFGFSEFGIHLFELLWLLAFTAVLMVTLRGAFRLRWLSAFVPVATIGVYYGMAGENQLTQLEFLVSLPLFAQVLCLLKSHRHPRAMPALYFVSGLMAGVAVLFKMLLAPLCVGLWLVALAYQFRTHGFGLAALFVRAVLPATLGVALTLGSVVLLYVYWGHLDDLIWSTLVYPPQALASSPPSSPSRLVSAAGFFLAGFAPWALFALIAAVSWFRSRRDLLGALMLTWLVIGVVLFFVQRFSWWEYHTLLVLFPAGLLAVLGIDRLVAWASGENRAGAARTAAFAFVLALSASASLTGGLIEKAKPLLANSVIKPMGVAYYQAQVSEHYGLMRRGVRFLKSPDALPGPVYAFGNAMVHEFSGRASAHRTVGSSWEFFLPEQIDDILQSLDRQRVPYVFVDRQDTKLFYLRPKVRAYLFARYTRHQTDGSGTWYIRRELKEKRSEKAP